MIAITGATGHLGILTIQALLDQGIAAHEILALVRSPEKAAGLASQGIQVRQADYHQSEALKTALQGVQKLLLISSSDFNDRLGQHRHVIEAAKHNSVKLLAYTSVLRADTSKLALAKDHKGTEDLIRAAGLPFVFLRNSWYLENYNPVQAAAQGAIAGSAGNGRVSAASRADYAAAAAAVLTQAVLENAIYELGGDEAFTMSELAAEVQAQSGRVVLYQNMPAEAYAGMLQSFGVPAVVSQILADSDVQLEQGELFTDRKDLSKLIGRPTTTLSNAVKMALKDVPLAT
jgi:NAD(P)H dehydrogenase (quinone)